MQDVKTLAEAAEELGRLTEKQWSQSEILHYCSQKLIPLLAKITIQEEDIDAVRGRQGKSAMWRDTIWQDAHGHFNAYVPIKPEAAWLLRQDGVAKIRHPADGPRAWPVREMLVNLEQVKVDTATIQRIKNAFQQPIAATAQTAATLAPVGTASDAKPRLLIDPQDPTPEQGIAKPNDAIQPPNMPTRASATMTEPERRLARLRGDEVRGEAKYKNCEWSFRGSTILAKLEKSEGRARSSEKTIRADLKEAALAERDAKAAGFGTGFGQR